MSMTALLDAVSPRIPGEWQAPILQLDLEYLKKNGDTLDGIN